jgi:hypothetical protein
VVRKLSRNKLTELLLIFLHIFITAINSKTHQLHHERLESENHANLADTQDMTDESSAVISRDLHAILRETIERMDTTSVSKPAELNSSDRDMLTTFGYCSDTPTCDPLLFFIKQHKMHRINGEGRCFEYCIFDILLWFNAKLSGYKCGVCPTVAP